MKKLIIFLLFLFAPATVFAGNDLTVTCRNDACSLNQDAAFLNGIDLSPGDIIIQNLTVINQRNDACFLTFNLDNNNPAQNIDLLDKLVLSVAGGSTVWYSGSLSDLSDNVYRTLGKLNELSTKQYHWSIGLDPSVGNDYQNRSTKFDLNFNFSCYQPDILGTNSPTAAKTAGYWIVPPLLFIFYLLFRFIRQFLFAKKS